MEVGALPGAAFIVRAGAAPFAAGFACAAFAAPAAAASAFFCAAVSARDFGFLPRSRVIGFQNVFFTRVICIFVKNIK